MKGLDAGKRPLFGEFAHKSAVDLPRVQLVPRGLRGESPKQNCEWQIKLETKL
jgi:hypothetical protein